MSTLVSLIARAKSLAQDHAEHASEGDWDGAFREALSIYNRDSPRQIVEDNSGDGSAYDFPLAGFDPSISSVVSVEYPADQRLPVLLDASAWMVYQRPDGPVLRMLHRTPATGESVRITYSAAHSISGFNDADTTTIPGAHLEALVALTASQVLRRLANRFLHEQDNAILHGDQVDRLSKSDEARKRARELEEMYRRIVGLRNKPSAAGAVLDWDTSFSGTGVDHLTHSRRWR